MSRLDHAAIIEGLHGELVERFDAMRTGEEWLAYLTAARRFHRYSPNNQLLLALQGADGFVASYRNWQRIPAQGGGTCQVAKGEHGLVILAPLLNAVTDVDDATGEETTRNRLFGFRTVKVFHQGQLAAPPDIPEPQMPGLLTGDNGWQHVWVAVVAELERDGFTVNVASRNPVDDWNGRTQYDTRTVTVLDDLEPPQRLKTLLHEWAHVRLDHEHRVALGREMREIEAESVAFILAGSIGLDSGDYSIPYICGWSGGDPELLAQSAERVLGTSKQLVAVLEHDLGIDLTPDALDHACNDNVIALASQPDNVTSIDTRPIEPDRTPAVTAVQQEQFPGLAYLNAHRKAYQPPSVAAMPDTIQAFASQLEPSQREQLVELIYQPDSTPKIATLFAEAGFSGIQVGKVLEQLESDPDVIAAALSAPVNDPEQRQLYSNAEVAVAIEQLDPPPGSDMIRDNIDTSEALDEREGAGSMIIRAHRQRLPAPQVAALAYGLGVAPIQVIDLFRRNDVSAAVAAQVAIAMHNGNTARAVHDLHEAWPDPPDGWPEHLHPSIAQHLPSHQPTQHDSIQATLNRWAGIPAQTIELPSL